MYVAKSDNISAPLNCTTVLCQTNERDYVVNTEFCWPDPKVVPLYISEHPTDVIFRTSEQDSKPFFCKLKFLVPPSRLFIFTVDPLSFVGEKFHIQVSCIRYDNSLSDIATLLLNKAFNFTVDRDGCEIWYISGMLEMTPLVTLHIVSFPNILPSGRLSAISGYVTSPYFDGFSGTYPGRCDHKFHIVVPKDHCVLVKFTHFQLAPDNDCLYFDMNYELFCRDYVSIMAVKSYNTSGLLSWKDCGFRNPFLQVYFQSIIIHFSSTTHDQFKGFRLVYTIVSVSQQPVLVDNDVYNCSVPHFHKYKEIFGCNFIRECKGNEDEQNCSFHDTACGVGAVASGEKCYALIYPHRRISWYEARSMCSSKHQFLLMLTPHDQQKMKVLKLLASNFSMYEVFVGIQLGLDTFPAPLSALYRTFWRWVDGRTAFTRINYLERSYKHLVSRFPKCGVFWIPFFRSTVMNDSVAVECNRPLNVQVVCEFNKPTTNLQSPPTSGNISLDMSHFHSNILGLISCPLSHTTKDFLHCDFESQCGAEQMLMYCPLLTLKVSMFMCEDGAQTMHFSLVCDHVKHCQDNSDEDFCFHKPCTSDMFSCDNHQCLNRDVQCNGKLDCFDKSDELCSIQELKNVRATEPPPAIVYLRDNGTFNTTASRSCPLTHFKCLDQYCLPVYLRCNGIADCADREDEVYCDSYTCQGYYRCRSSAVCLHPDHVCDGVVHCPQYDDELVCQKVNCPDVCQCQGLAFICTANFDVSFYRHLRYLDVTDTHRYKPQSLASNLYLISVCLSNTGLTSVPLLALPNLQHLDLSNNAITSISIQSISILKNLKVFTLSGNPLLTVSDTEMSFPKETVLKSSSYGQDLMRESFSRLTVLDLSHTHVNAYNSSVFASFLSLKSLNISWSWLHSIPAEGFNTLQNLETVDIRGTTLITFPRTLLKNLTALQYVYSDNPLLCCEDMLPSNFYPGLCVTKPDLVSSCECLLRSNTFRVFMWIVFVLSVTGNICTLIWKLKARNSQACGFHVFIKNLLAADLCEGLYMTIVLTADHVYRGGYLWHANKWKNSVMCQLSGFLSLTFLEVSAFFVFLIALERFLVVCFPSSSLHFSRRSSIVACTSVWVASILVAAMPLLPVTSRWRSDQQTSICIPLPLTEQFQSRSYSLGVLIIVIFVLFILVAFIQAISYHFVHTSSITYLRQAGSSDKTFAAHVETVVLANVICWFSVGLLRLLVSSGLTVPDRVNVSVATMVLPLNAALNPVLYVLSVVSEKQKRQQRERLLEQMRAKLGLGIRRPVTVLSKQTAVAQIKTYIRAHALTLEDIYEHLNWREKHHANQH